MCVQADGEDGGDADAAAGGDGTTSDPILVNFKKRKPSKKLEAERRRKREAGELALKKKLLKARDHRIPTVISEPAEVRLRKLATKGGTCHTHAGVPATCEGKED